MTAQLRIIEFIKEHPHNWRELLSQPPYHLTARDDGVYTILTYHLFYSDFTNPMVRECRGLILRNDTYKPVCVPFFKFGNYGESYCPEIDWHSAKVQEKIDGSLIKCWFDDGKFNISTNGMIDAFKAPVGHPDFSSLTFGELFHRASRLDFKKLNEDHTYMFELVSPDNRIVVPYQEAAIYHIGTRHNKTLEELNVNIDVPKPKEYGFASIEECIAAAKALPYSEEGYVVVDKYWNRVKIKSPAYVCVSHLKNNDNVTTRRILELLRTGETQELLTYFPEYSDAVENVTRQVQRLEQRLNDRCKELQQRNFETQKDFALHVMECDPTFSAYYFEWRKNGTVPIAWINKLPIVRLEKYLEK